MASVWANRAIGIDVSHYQDKIDWSKCDADFVIIKAGEGKTPDPKVAEHVQGAYDAGFPIGLYWFHDPAMYALAGFPLDDKSRWWSPAQDPQLQALIKTCGTKAFNFLCLDNERWWLYYTEYFEYLNGQRKLEDVKRVTNGWISESSRVESGRIQDWLLANYPSVDNPAVSSRRLVQYSANWFINSFAPDIRNWIDQYDQWPAEYPYANGTVAVQNLAEFREKYLPADTFKPKWLGNKQWFILQVSGDKFTVPWILGANGKPSAIDINLSYLPKDQFLAAIGATSKPTPPPLPPPNENTSDLAKSIEALHTRVDQIYDLLDKHFK